MFINTWSVQPLYATIIEILKEKGQMRDDDLFEILKAFHRNAGLNDLYKTLMVMEISGLIQVSSISKDQVLVQMVKKS